MKRTLGVVIVLGAVVGLGYLSTVSNTTEFDNQPDVFATSTEPVATSTPADLLEEATQKMIEEAIAASSEEIETAKKEASDRIEKEMRLKIEREVRLQITDSNDGALRELEKDLSF